MIKILYAITLLFMLLGIFMASISLIGLVPIAILSEEIGYAIKTLANKITQE